MLIVEGLCEPERGPIPCIADYGGECADDSHCDLDMKCCVSESCGYKMCTPPLLPVIDPQPRPLPSLHHDIGKSLANNCQFDLKKKLAAC